MYAKAARTYAHLTSVYPRLPGPRKLHHCSGNRSITTTTPNQSHANLTPCQGLSLSQAWAPQTVGLGQSPIERGYDGNSPEAVTPIKGPKPDLYSQGKRRKQEPVKFFGHLKHRQRASIESIVASHRIRLCSKLLSAGHSSESIAAQWRESSDTIRLSAVGAYLVSTGRDRILLRMLEGYLSAAAASRKWPTDMNASAKVLIWCIENIYKLYRSKTVSFRCSRSRAERILAILILMTQHRFGYGLDPIKIGASRARFLLHLLPPKSTFRLYSTLMLSKSEVPHRVLLSALHTLSEAGMFVQALQVFQKLVLSPAKDDYSLMLRRWQFRRLFLKLYRAGIPIHKSDVMGFFSSFGRMDPLIYKLLVYSAAGVNDANSVHLLAQDYENQTGAALPLDVVSAVFLMHHRLGDSNKLELTYNDACKRGLKPLSSGFFVTAVMLVETHKENASYWDLCKIYGRFFKPFTLNLLGLPLPAQRATSTYQGALLEPTVGTLTVMLNSYLRTVAGNLEGSRYALTIYKRYVGLLRDNGHIPQFQAASEHFIACIVSAVAKYKPNLGLALGILQDMIDFSDLPHPTSLTWDSLLQASTLHGDLDTSEKIWEAMLEHGIPPTTHTYSAMIMLYATTGDREKSEVLRSRIVQEGWALTPHLQNVLDVAQRKLTYRMLQGTAAADNQIPTLGC
ncbi:hypothetical protein TWF718_004841 [Orbilia javanica]|uniref:Pentatricopeptide repeat-containing protein n=1 Tax=Orbilia javanica TaxID=47235 RepID=A0AAN8N6V8_9PEZI